MLSPWWLPAPAPTSDPEPAPVERRMGDVVDPGASPGPTPELPLKDAAPADPATTLPVGGLSHGREPTP